MARSSVQRNYTAVPPDKVFQSPSFDPSDLEAKAAAIAALLQQVNLNVNDFCGGNCDGGKKCRPIDLLKDPTGPGDLELVQEGSGKKHQFRTTGPTGAIRLYSNNCKCL